MTHQDAIRARREALEKSRQESLQKALSKGATNSAMSREDEISHLQEQIGDKSCSAAALVGLKKRLATLKAAALREERKRKSVLSSVQPGSTHDETPVGRTGYDSPQHSAPTQACTPSQQQQQVQQQQQQQQQQHMPIPAATHEDSPRHRVSAPLDIGQDRDNWPEPARPPPRSRNSQEGLQRMAQPAAIDPYANGYSTPSHDHMYSGSVQSGTPTHFSAGCGQLPERTPVGAASAPWANAFSNGVTAQS